MRTLPACACGVGLALALLAAPASAQKYGGVLRGMLRETPANFSALEANTYEPVVTSAPIYNNLVVFDPLKSQESLANIIPDLAEKWTTSEGGKRLTFTLRRGVKWQDGKPFTSADVKHTLDLLRGTSKARLRLNPRKTWFWNVKDVQVRGDHEVSLILGAPQPSLLVLLACELVPIVPAHVDPNELRLKPMGTGPFRLKQYVPEERVELEKNPDYWMKGRPYLDGVNLYVIKARPSRLAALTLNQVDFSVPLDQSLATREQLQRDAPTLRVQETANDSTDNLLVNAHRPPFDDVRIRRALNLALDRSAYIRSKYQGAAQEGGALLPPPYGVWGLPADDVAKLPGYGDPARNLDQARSLIKSVGYGPDKPLKVIVSTRALENYLDTAAWVLSQLKTIYMDPELEQIDTGIWFAKMARREYQVAVNITANVVDDPDAVLFENFACGSERNYSDYCNPELQKLFEAQSAQAELTKRMALVHEIDARLQTDVARPVLAYRPEYFITAPYVKNLIAHQSIYNHWRFQEVWLNK